MTRRFRAVCPGVLEEVGGLFTKPTPPLPFHYPGEGPQECKFCYPPKPWYNRFWTWLKGLRWHCCPCHEHGFKEVCGICAHSCERMTREDKEDG